MPPAGCKLSKGSGMHYLLCITGSTFDLGEAQKIFVDKVSGKQRKGKRGKQMQSVIDLIFVSLSDGL